ncbi:HD-GYP domain-containing protein [Indiicoccus explosivorum]|uniref:HD-GYP domain-containing protein n=1 Tax=Indiicoccus explosivorum TaxID=1917864 RepID=UPI000B45306A|nr:HD domain-containing phosphohydrolase [Indiicoccus explosivorum]
MGTIQLPVESLRAGQLIAENVYSLSTSPIVPANTSVTEEIKEVLLAFSIQKVHILQNDSAVPEAKTEIGELTATREEPSGFELFYKEAVSQHKSEYFKWTAGSKVDLSKMRQLVLAPGDELLKNRSTFLDIHRLSSEADYIHHHAVAVGIIAGALAQRIGFPKGQVQQVMTAGILADSGIAKIDQRIIKKRTALNAADSLAIRQHPVFSFQFVKESPLLKPEMKLAIVQHHERLDGSGYPQGEKTKKISLSSQLIAVADTYHALVCDRTYKKAVTPFQAFEILLNEEFGKFHAQAVDALTGLFSDQLIGRKVRLTDGDCGEVLFIQPASPLRPLIRKDANGTIINLDTDRSLSITDIAD